MTNNYKTAKKRIKRKKNLINEIISYTMTILGLMFLNLYTAPYNLWFLWVAVPWGLVLIGRALSMYIHSRTDDWERRELEKEMVPYEEDSLDLDEFNSRKQPEILRNGRYSDDEFV